MAKISTTVQLRFCCKDGATHFDHLNSNTCYTTLNRRCGLMVSVLDSGSSGPGSSPGQGAGLCSWALYSHSASFVQVYMSTGEFTAEGNPAMD